MMKGKKYRKFTKKNDPRIMLRLPQEAYEDLLFYADKNKRTIQEEVLARAVVTLEHQEIMAEDRWMRLIFCKKLAHQGRP